tara:strand:- start:376 stop:570 length:195 start_codon:yes stop_codon:yes gene_type:complete
MSDLNKGRVEITKSTLVLRDDGRVDCYNSAGYRILDLDSLPEDIQGLVKQQSVTWLKIKGATEE